MPLPTKFIIFVIFACFGQSKQLLATLSLIDKVVILFLFDDAKRNCWSSWQVQLVGVVTYVEHISKSDIESRNDLECNLKVLIFECNI